MNRDFPTDPPLFILFLPSNLSINTPVAARRFFEVHALGVRTAKQVSVQRVRDGSGRIPVREHAASIHEPHERLQVPGVEIYLHPFEGRPQSFRADCREIHPSDERSRASQRSSALGDLTNADLRSQWLLDRMRRCVQQEFRDEEANLETASERSRKFQRHGSYPE